MGRGDERGQSELLATLLIFGIIVSIIGFNQVFLVPLANEDIEVNHDKAVHSDMVELRSGIVEAAGSNTQQSITVSLGADFPPRLLALNPPPATGTLQTDPPVANGGNIWIEDANFSIRNLCGMDDSGDNVSTTFVAYDADYNHFEGSGTTLVENTVTHREAGTVVDTNQVIVKGNQIRIIRVVGVYQEAGTQKRTIDLFPSATNVTNTSEEFNITLPSQLSASTWNQTLLDGEESVEHVKGSGNTVTIDLDSPANKYNVKCTTVGIGEQPAVDVDQPEEVELVSDVLINPLGSDVLELREVDPGNNPDYNLTFLNNATSPLTLNRSRVLYAIGPGETTGTDVDFTSNGTTTTLTIGDGLTAVANVTWSPSGRESVQLDGFNSQNSGVAIELELITNTGETKRFVYFASN